MRWVRRLHDLTPLDRSGDVTCHGDLGVHNLLYAPDGGAAGLIDFDLAHRGPRSDDLSTALKELARLGGQGRRATRCGRRSGCWTRTAGKRSPSRPSWPRSL